MNLKEADMNLSGCPMEKEMQIKASQNALSAPLQNFMTQTWTKSRWILLCNCVVYLLS